MFINASTLGTTHILLNSISDAFPNGLGNSSGQVGHNLMDHHYGVGATGESDDFADQYILAEEPTAFIFPVSAT